MFTRDKVCYPPGIMATNPPQMDLADRLRQQVNVSRRMRDESSLEMSMAGDDFPLWCVTGRKLLAFIIDGIFIYGIGRGLAFLAPGQLRALGEDGWWVGILIACVYFTLMDSVLGSGKSFGKRLMGIEIRRTDGGFINPVLSLLRFLPIGVAWTMLSAVQYVDPADPQAWGSKLTALFILFGIGTFALAHPQRRTIQDLIAGSIVVRSGVEFHLEKASFKDPLLVYVTLILFLLVGVVPVQMSLIHNPAVHQTSLLLERLSRRTDIGFPIVTSWFSFERGVSPALTYTVDVFVPSGSDGAKSTEKLQSGASVVQSTALARSVADDVLSSGAIPKGVKQVTIRLRTGFDIGVWQEMESKSYSFPTAKVAPVSPQQPSGPTIRYKTTLGGSRVKIEAQKKAAAAVKNAPAAPGAATAKPKAKPSYIKTPTQ